MGDDPRFFVEAAQRWAARWGGDEGAVSLSAPGLSASSFHTEVRSLPMMKPMQVLRLTHLEGASRELWEAVATYSNRPSPSTALLMEYAGAAPKSKATAGKAEAPATPPDPLALIFARVSSLECKPPSVRAYASQRLAAESFEVLPEVLDALEEWACRDLGKAAAALDLLTLYRAGEKRIAPEDLGALLGAGGSPERWGLQDAFATRNRKLFLKLLATAERDPEVERDRAGAAIAFVGLIARQVRLLLAVKGIEASGKSLRSIIPEDLGLKKQFPAQKAVEASQRWREDQLRSSLEALYRLDLSLKGGGERGEPWALVQKHLAPLLSAEVRKGER